MKKVVKLSESDLTKIVTKILNEEGDYSSDSERGTQPREKDIKSVFGPKYGQYIPNDVLRYLRKNPTLVFKRLYEIYGEDCYMYLDKAR